MRNIRTGSPRRVLARRVMPLFVLAVAFAAARLAGAQAPAPAAVAAAPAAPSAAAGPVLRLPADAVYAHRVKPDSAVVFSHRTHVQYEGNTCTGCHPKLFRILGGDTLVTHKDMEAGSSCGACHNGEKTFGVKESGACVTCHSGRKPSAMAAGGEAAPAASRVPKPFFYPRGGDSPGLVTFKHETHAKAKCVDCHTKLFPMKITPARPDGAMHEAGSCGSCHDGRKAFDVENPDLCDKCHVEPRGGGR